MRHGFSLDWDKIPDIREILSGPGIPMAGTILQAAPVPGFPEGCALLLPGRIDAEPGESNTDALLRAAREGKIVVMKGFSP
jgi:hypothetical protein